MAADNQPNILVLLSDQHSKFHLGCYGDPLVRTPNLDRLAAEGMRFDAAYCPAPLCCPSRMSFMTGRTPSRNQVWGNHHTLNSGIPTWPHALGAAGYDTALIGRMHFNGPDQRHGFFQRPLGEYSARFPGAPEKGGPRWQHFPASTSGQSRVAVEIAGRGTTTYQYFDEQVSAATCAFLEEKSKAGQPFAAVAGFVLPHCPFIAPKELFDYYYPRVDIPSVESPQPASIERFRRMRGLMDPPLDDERVRVARAAYFALCEYFDQLIGQVLDCLEQTGLAQNTLVVYASDHGEMAGEHGCWWKSNYYEGSVGIPLIARLPDTIPRQSTSPAVCNLIDLGPTFADASGAEPIPGCDGRSLWPTLQGKHPTDWQNETYSELVDSNSGLSLPSRMVRQGRYKLWTYADKEQLPPTLFDLETDPDELNDLAQDPIHTQIRDELLAKVHRNWNPQQAVDLTLEQDRANTFISAWGRTLKPTHPDTLPVPPPAIEDDVELL